MLRLKNRNLQIPNGMSFYLPELKWSPPKFASFDTIVNMVMQQVQSNPAVADKHKWPRDRAGVELWVDRFNAQICLNMGWKQYVIDDGPAASDAPKSLPPLHRSSRFARLVAGARTLADWLGSGGQPVAIDLADKRAEICATCPANRPGDLGDFFTKAASEVIQSQLEKRKELQLSTKHDSSLNVCVACGCPLKLKVHVPLSHIAAKMSEETKAELDKRCWILKEK